MEEMLHHCRAVARGAKNALIVGDMPFLSYHTSIEDGIRNAGRFLKEGGAHAVKLERAATDDLGPRGVPPVAIELTEALSARGIPTMGHVGLTPQSVHAMGGYRVQGRGEEASARVIEGIPAALAREVTERSSVPTIGIGAGPHCDAQVLVFHDLLGINPGPFPKFVKPYANLRAEISDAVTRFAADVEAGAYPDDEHSYR